MQLHITTICIIIFDHINKIFTHGIPISPCPKMFQYRFDGTEWFGLLSVRSPDFGQALHLRVTLSMRGKPTTNYLGEIELLTRGQFLSDAPVLYKIKFPKNHFPPKLLQITTNNHVVCLGSSDHSIFVTQIQLEHTRKFTFLPDGLPLPPTFTEPSSSVAAGVKDFPLLPTNMEFDTKHLPQANFEIPMRASKNACGTIDDRIRFHISHVMKEGLSPSQNGRSENEKLVTAGDSFPRARPGGSTGASIPIAADVEANTPPSLPTFAADTDEDGSTTIVDELPSITRGAWPWLAAIYVNNLTSLAYQCGGTLVSTRIVISSAHCFQMFKNRYTANEVLVFLGRHNLKNWNEEGSLAAPVDDIFIHPDYDSHLNTYDADIAVVILKHEVRFNTFIRPACMWSGSTNSQYIEGEHGFVVGWGLGNINSTLSDASLTATVPKMVDAPIVSNDVCFKANNKFRSLSSNRTFCAGLLATKASVHKEPIRRKLPSGPCAGDSGAGLMIFKSNRWMLRGTVSATLPFTSSSTGSIPDSLHKPSNCNVNEYIIYTDVAKFLDWILAFTI